MSKWDGKYVFAYFAINPDKYDSTSSLSYPLSLLLKVFNSKEVGEVKEGADRYSAKKLSKHCKG